MRTRQAKSERERRGEKAREREMDWDRVRELLVTEPHKKRCVFPSSLCTRPKSNVSFCIPAWVNEKVWELVTYCNGALLDWVYILN